jgi:predicted alpha/beta hydrolase family esterase
VPPAFCAIKNIVINDSDVLILPGWQSAGPQHWQSRWVALHGYQRVEQHDWLRPLRGDWIARLEEVLLARAAPVWLVGHSLGCLLVAAWAAHSQQTTRVAGALLVAPGDPELPVLRAALRSWAPVQQVRLPFPALLVGSSNDPYCSLARAQQFGHDWGAGFVSLGARGHLNADSGLDDWPEGHQWLCRLQAVPAGTRLPAFTTTLIFDKE